MVSMAFLLAALAVRAQSVSFINLADNAERMAMGGTDVSYSVSRLQERGYSGSVEASYVVWEPSALSSSSIRLYMLDGFARLGENCGLIAKGKLNSISQYVSLDGNGNQGKPYSPLEFMAGLGLYYHVGSNISLLTQVNLISSKLAVNFAGTTVAADIGVAYDWNDLSLALTARNLGPKLKYAESAKEKLPMVVMFGAEKHFGLNRSSLEVALDAGFMPLHPCAVAKVGAKYSIRYVFDIMAGYHFGSNSQIEPRYGTVGLGVHVSKLNLSAVYYITNARSPLKNTFAFTVGARF